MQRIVIFDYDGWIINSIPQMYAGECAIFAAEGKLVPSLEELRMGWGTTDDWLGFYRRFGITASPEEIIRVFFSACRNEEAEVYPEIPELLRIIRDCDLPVVIVSTHPAREIAKKLLREGLFGRFAHIVGSQEQKAQTFEKVCRSFGTNPGDSIIVGDQASDVRHGKRAGLLTVSYTGGWGHVTGLRAARPHYLIDRHLELVDIIEGLAQK